MKTTIINTRNFEKTLQTTLDSEGDFYLDRHTLNGKEYFTVSRHEFIIGCFTLYNEAYKIYLDRTMTAKANAGHFRTPVILR